MSDPVLACRGLSKGFGGIVALDGVDLDVAAGEIVGLIGPNGSGKSTLVNVVSGYVRPDAGTVTLDGRRMTGSSPARIRRCGVSRTFQNLRLYPQLSVLENLLLGLHLHFTGGRQISWRWIGGLIGTPSAARTERRAREEAHAALMAVSLEGRADELAGALSYGEQKRLELARATLLAPRVLVLDEPTAGLATGEATDLMSMFSQGIRGSTDRCLLVAEHHLDLVLSVCTRVAVLDSGRKIVDALPAEVASNEEVMRVYVGE